jgi:nicotinamide-nucleotide amidase
MPSAEIITIGTEILLGEIVDTNTHHIAQQLRDLGIDLYRTSTTGDNPRRIAEAIHDSMGRAEIVITTGGLGPTIDDPTRQAVAEALGVELEFRQELWGQIVERVAYYGRTPGDNQKRQAYVPQGAIAIKNPVGTAPAFIVEFTSPLSPPLTGEEREVKRGIVISLPGVPREMETLLQEAVIPYLQKRFNLHQVIKVRLLHTSGVGESLIDDQIDDFETLANPTVGLAAHSGIVDIRIAAKANSEPEAKRMITEAETELRRRLGKSIFGADLDTLEGVVMKAVAERGWKLASVEAGLGGALKYRLVGSQNEAYLGGENLSEVSNSCNAMVRSVKDQYQASTALGAFLQPKDGRQSVNICLITPRGEQERRLTYGGHPGNAPLWATNMALDLLRVSLLND